MEIKKKKKIGDRWFPSSVKYILTNERNCGDILIHKTVTVDIFTHKTIKNTGQERSYRLKNYHQGIVSYDEWLYACVILGELPFDTIHPKDAPDFLIDGVVYKQIDISGARLLDEAHERM